MARELPQRRSLLIPRELSLPHLWLFLPFGLGIGGGISPNTARHEDAASVLCRLLRYPRGKLPWLRQRNVSGGFASAAHAVFIV